MSQNVFSKVEINLVNSKTGGKTVGRGSVVIADAVQVYFTIAEGKNGLFAKLPQHKGKGKDAEGKEVDRYFYDVRFPNKDTYEAFQKLVISEFNQVKKNGPKSAQKAAGEEPQVTADDCPF